MVRLFDDLAQGGDDRQAEIRKKDWRFFAGTFPRRALVPGAAAVPHSLPRPIPVEAAGLLTPEAVRVLDRAPVLALEVLLQGVGGNHRRRQVLPGYGQEMRNVVGRSLERRTHEMHSPCS
jgi:hypothetical protein